MERCNLSSFRYSPLGLRDGLLAQMLAEHDRAARTHQHVEAKRRDAILATCRHYGVEMKVAESVRGIVLRLFRELRRMHGLPSDYEAWLSAAAMLHDVGRFVSRNGRHRHTYYLIAHSEIFGFTAEERRIVAAIARHLGKSRPDPDEAPMRGLSDEDTEFVPHAVVLLRLAKAMNPGPAGNITNVVATTDRDRVRLRLNARTSPDLEVWLLEKERSYFREVFGRDLVVGPA